MSVEFAADFKGVAPADVVACPRCHGENSADAAFCANPDCHKALGEFAYVAEEFGAGSNWIQRLADRISDWVGHPHFVTLHALWFVGWFGLNSVLVGASQAFDAYPYSLLGIILAVEAILITGVLMISNQRRAAFEGKRAELEYEVNFASYRLLRDVARDTAELRRRLDSMVPSEADT